MKARNAGFHQVLILSNIRRLVQTVNKERNPNWQERTMMADLSSLHQNGFILKMLFVPKVVINSVCYVANIATQCHFTNAGLDQLFVTNSLFSPFEWY